MDLPRSLLVACGLTALSAAPLTAQPAAASLEAAAITAQAGQLAAAQWSALARRPGKHAVPGRNWEVAVFYAGAAAWAGQLPDALTLDPIRALGQRNAWQLATRPKDDLFADDYCLGQAYLAVYEADRDESEIAALAARCTEVEQRLETKQAGRPLWWWCDALFMAPPVLARLAADSDQPRLLDALDAGWWRTTARLYDPRQHLFYRDARFLKLSSASGQPIFWSRGNGWVLAGLVRVLDAMPADYPSRPRYLQLYGELAGSLAELQRPDGTWPASLLDAPAYRGSETSGTAFICYGLAWGINHRLLWRDNYLPIVARAWAALLASRRPDGLPGYVQPVGDRPAPATVNGTQPYATGAMLLAASQLLQLAPFDLPAAPLLHAAAANESAPAADLTR